jgi:hypothetical protein
MFVEEIYNKLEKRGLIDPRVTPKEFRLIRANNCEGCHKSVLTGLSQSRSKASKGNPKLENQNFEIDLRHHNKLKYSTFYVNSRKTAKFVKSE